MIYKVGIEWLLFLKRWIEGIYFFYVLMMNINIEMRDILNFRDKKKL